MPTIEKFSHRLDSAVYGQEYYRYTPSGYEVVSGTPSFAVPEWFKSGTAGAGIAQNNSDRHFIKLHESFNKRIKEIALPEGQQEYVWEEKMKISASALLDVVTPDLISLDFTHDYSIFYTLFKNDMTIFFEHFMVDEFDENDEAGFNIYRGNENIGTFGGSLHDGLSDLNFKLTGTKRKLLMVA